MTENRFTVPLKYSLSHSKIQLNGEPLTNNELVRILNTNDGAFLENFNLKRENKKLKEEIEKLQRFEHTGEHIRLSINIETGKLQRHIYATGQWFGDFDRVLCENWISKEDYQKFIDRVIEVYNTEFKGDVE